MGVHRLVFARTPSDRTKISKISPVSVPSIHLGLNPERKGHVVYIPYLNRITTAYHLQFQESEFASFNDEHLWLARFDRPSAQG